MTPRNLVLPLSLVLLATPAAPEIVERVIARVNADIVTLSDFEARQAAAIQSARLAPAEVESYLRQNNTRILQEAIDDLLVYQRGLDMGIRLRPEYLNEVIESIKKDNNIQSEAQFQEQLRHEGMTLDDLKRSVERSLVRSQVIAREVQPKLAVSEADARAEYEAHQADYAEAATVHLLVAHFPGDSRLLAEETMTRARAGEPLLEVAAAKGGTATDLGKLRRGDLSPEIENVVFDLAPGAVSPPVASETGLSVFQVKERTEGHQVSFAEVKDELLKRLTESRGKEEYEKYMTGLRKAAVIDIRVREVPLQLAPSGAPASTPGPAAGGAAPAASAAPATPPVAAPSDSEFSTTPQTAPERVTPPGAPAASPSPEPSPSAPPVP